MCQRVNDAFLALCIPFQALESFVCTKLSCDFSRAFFGRPHKVMSFKNIFFPYKY